MENAAIFGLALLAGFAILAAWSSRGRRQAQRELGRIHEELEAARGALSEQRAQAERERTVAERERALVRDLRELGDLKDRLLSDRAAEIEEREQLISELTLSNTELARINYTVSHDLKNPLVTIKNFLGLVRRDAASGSFERLEHDIGRISAAADKMDRLLEDLLELSRVGRPVDSPRDVEMAEVVSASLDQLRGPIAERGVLVTVSSGLPVVRGDRARLVELVRNLVDNAVRYLGDQVAPAIEIGCRQEGAEDLLLYVRDNGMGIDAPYQRKVFGLFERLETGTEGTGVGLALAKQIVAVHGGRIWVESEGSGRGSTFFFTLSGGGTR